MFLNHLLLAALGGAIGSAGRFSVGALMLKMMGPGWPWGTYTVNILGYTYSPDLRAEIEQANVHYGLDLKMRYDNNASNLLRRSDQWPFLQNGVPAVFVHTGLHPDYHTERDRPESLNYEKMARIVRMVHQVSWNLSQTSDRPAVARR